MIRYEVRLLVDPLLAEAVEAYMVSHHIPQIMAAGCFLRAGFERAEEGAFRTTYVAASREEVDRYLHEHAAHFRADFLERFPEGVTPVRELWTLISEWSVE